MSYSIIYGRQFVKTTKGIIPMIFERFKQLHRIYSGKRSPRTELVSHDAEQQG